MLRESVEVMRELWKGEFVDHHGEHYTVENARIYTRPDTPPPVYVSGFGPRAATLASEIVDGFVTITPDGEMVQRFRDAGGEGKPVHAGYKVCWSNDDATAIDTAIDTAHDLWSHDGLPGELAQTLSSPKHFEQASTLIGKDAIRDPIAYGNDIDRHVEAFRPFVEAGVDVVHVSQIGAARPGTNAEGFFEFYRDTMLPRLREIG